MGDQGSGSSIVEIAAARALQWNVEFDRGLRSSKPGAQCEAVMRLGLHLVRWSHDPPVTASSASMFKLEPGQDRVFANSILLRLAETFRSGNNFIRVCILRVFLLEYRGTEWNGEYFATDSTGRIFPYRTVPSKHGSQFSDAKRKLLRKDGLLTKKRIANHVEMLKRVKSVLDSGDPTARAIAFRVIGCLADLGGDSIDVHNVILQALHSSYQQEVSAAFFAAGCLSEVSEEFSVQALEKAVAMIGSMETPPAVKICAIRFFTKLGFWPAVSLKAHEAGRNQMITLPTTEIITTLLISLTKLALKSAVLMRSQVDLLLTYLSSDPRLHVRSIALVCLLKISSRALHCTDICEEDIILVLSIVEDLALPPALHVLGLQVLQKLLCHKVSTPKAEKLLKIASRIELIALRREWAVVLQALHVLIEIAVALKTAGDSLQHGYSYNLGTEEIDIVSRLGFLLCDQMSIAVGVFMDLSRVDNRSLKLTEKGVYSNDEAANIVECILERVSVLCTLLKRFVQESPEVGASVLDCLLGSFEAVVEASMKRSEAFDYTTVSQMEIDGNVEMDLENESMLKLGAPERQLELQRSVFHNYKVVASMLSRCLCTCICAFSLERHIIKGIHLRLHHLAVGMVTTKSSDACVSPVLDSLMKASFLYSSVLFTLEDPPPRVMEFDGIKKLRLSLGKGVDQEIESSRDTLHQLVTVIIHRCQFWVAYKAGIKAACCNFWETADSIFKVLLERVKSEGCYFWLKTLHHLAQAESLLLFNSDINVDLADHRNMGLGTTTAHMEGAVQGNCITCGDNEGPSDFVEQPLARFECTNSIGARAAMAIPLFKCSMDSLSAGVCLERNFDFQQRVLTLRLALVDCVSELSGIAVSIACFDTDAGVIDLEHEEANDMKKYGSALRAGTEKMELLAVRFRRLTKSYDRLSSSFMGIDQESVKIISRAALLCSLLMFCVVGLFSPQTTTFQQGSSSSLNAGSVALDLFQRVQKMDGVNWDDLLLFSIQNGGYLVAGVRAGGCTTYLSQEVALITLCRWAVSSVLGLHKQLSLIGLVRAARLLQSILQACLNLPWLLPPCFFCTRPRTGVELFLPQAGTGEFEELSVSQGFPLGLNLCLQVVHMSSDPQFSPKKLFCALSFHPAESTLRAQETHQLSLRAGCTLHIPSDEDLTEKLIMGTNEVGSSGCTDVDATVGNCNFSSDGQDWQGGNDTFFSVLVDVKGQGFASCALDVSQAPCGEYRMSFSCLCQDVKGRQWILPLISTHPCFRIIPGT